MPPLLSNNHWLLIIMVLFTRHQIGQTIDVSNKSPLMLDKTKSGKLIIDKSAGSIRPTDKASASSISEIVNKKVSSSNESTLFLSTSSPISESSNSINNSDYQILIKSKPFTKSSTSSPVKLLNKLNQSSILSDEEIRSLNYRSDQVSLINQTLFNVSFFQTNDKTKDELKGVVQNETPLKHSKQLSSTLSNVSSNENSELSTLSTIWTLSSVNNVSLISLTKENRTMNGEASNNSVISSNDNTLHQSTKATNANRILSTRMRTIDSTPSTKLSSSEKQLKMNKIVKTQNDSSSTNHLPNVNESKIDGHAYSATSRSSLNEMNNQFKSVVRKDNNQIAKQVIVEIEEEDKLCLEQDGWPTTECSESAISNCSYPYTGFIYRFCYSSCQWSKVDTSQCKLAHLSEIHNLILYHVHKHLVDGLYPLVEELAKVTCSSSSPILSPIDRIDAFDALNAIFNSPALNVHFDWQEPEQRERELNFVKSILKVTDSLFMNQIVFETETEKNSLITFKTTETLLGLRRLIESTMRALIVQNEQNEIDIRDVRQVPLLDSESNLILMLIHRTRTDGKLLTLFNNEPQLPGANRLPHTALHLEELKDFDAGIAILSVNNLQKGGYTQSGKWRLLANPLLITIAPAISVQADFEQTPTINVEFTFLDPFVPLSTPVYCVRLANASKNFWTRSKCILAHRNTTTAQCACSVMGYLTVVASRGSGQLGRIIETESSTNYHQSYAFKLHKTLLIGSSASSLVIFLVIAFALLSNLVRNPHTNRRKFIFVPDQLERLSPSINNCDQQKSNWTQHTCSEKEFNEIQKQEIQAQFNDNLLRESKNKQFYQTNKATSNLQYCSRAQFNWLILICLFIVIQLFWCSGVLFPGDEFTIFNLWNKLITIYHGQNQLKPIFISSSWSFNLQSQSNHLVNFIDGQQYCLNFALVLHFLFTSCAIWMLLNTLHLYQHLRRSKLNGFKFNSTKQFPFNCCSFNYAKSTESLISKPVSVQSPEKCSTTPANNQSNQISSIEQLVEELNKKNLNQNENPDEKNLMNGTKQQADNLIYNREKKSCRKNCLIISPSKLSKKKKRRAFGQTMIYYIFQIKKHLHKFVYYSISWIIAASITILSYKLNPAGYETKRYCWMSIEGGIAYSFIVPISSLIILNTVFVLLALRHYLHLQRVQQKLNSTFLYDHDLVNSHSQFNCIDKICKFNFIFRSTYFNINLFVCCLPAFSIYWFFSVLALEMYMAAFQFIFALLNFLFSCCLLLLHLPCVKHELCLILHKDYSQNTQNLFQDDQLIRNEFNDELVADEDLIDEELIICVDYEDS